MQDTNGARAGAAGMDGDGGVAAARAISSSGCADSRRIPGSSRRAGKCGHEREPDELFHSLRRRDARCLFRNYFETRFHSGDDGDETWRARDLAFSKEKGDVLFSCQGKMKTQCGRASLEHALKCSHLPVASSY